MVKRIVLGSLVFLLTPNSSQCFNFNGWKIDINEQMISENSDAIMFAAATGCLAAAFFLYHYVTRFNFDDAKTLKESAANYCMTTYKYYEQEMQFAANNSNLSALKAELENIATRSDSTMPYTSYVYILRDSLKKCAKFEHAINKNLPKLKKTYSKLGHCNAQTQIHYKLMIKDLEELEVLMQKLAFLLKNFLSLSVQLEGYRHEQTLRALNDIAWQQFVHNLQPHQTNIYC